MQSDHDVSSFEYGYWQGACGQSFFIARFRTSIYYRDLGKGFTHVLQLSHIVRLSIASRFDKVLYHKNKLYSRLLDS